jgi:glycosyltransferase involved in cell wall biosynthesis
MVEKFLSKFKGLIKNQVKISLSESEQISHLNDEVASLKEEIAEIRYSLDKLLYDISTNNQLINDIKNNNNTITQSNNRKFGMILKRVNYAMRMTKSLLNLEIDNCQKSHEIYNNESYANSDKKFDVSVLITCHNYGRFIKENLDSIALQSNIKFEVLIINDASFDDSHQIISNIINDYKFPIRYIDSKINLGNAGSLNFMVELSVSDYVFILEADDILEPDCLNIFFKSAVDNNSDVVYSDYVEFYSNNIEVLVEPSKVNIYRLLAHNFIPLTSLIRRSSLLNIGGFRKNYTIQGMEDYEVWLKMFSLGYTFTSLNKVLWRYRKVHFSNMTISKVDDNYETSLYLEEIKKDVLNKVNFNIDHLTWNEEIKWDDYMIDKELANFLITFIIKNTPKKILECGPGVSTLIMAKIAKLLDLNLSIIALEHNKKYYEILLEKIKKEGVEDFVNLLHAPLKEYTFEGDIFYWYDLDINTISDDELDLMIVDGPPGDIQEKSRFMALPLMINKLKNNSYIILDDVHRDDEKEILNDWHNMFSIDSISEVGMNHKSSFLKLNK